MKTQHLLECIDSFSQGSSAGDFLSSIELKSLIQDIREASDAVHGVREFYEALERITNELRGMTEHSAAFLQKVRKAEAPNYYEVIKKPMDLGTVLKKVKAQQYKDKKAFHDDVNLIWDNCLEYNTWPDHPLRRSANILRNKTNTLLQFVAEIPTKAANASNRQGSIGLAAASDVDAEGDTDEEADETHRTRKGRTSQKNAAKSSNKRQALKQQDQAHREGSTPINNITEDAIQALTKTRENSVANLMEMDTPDLIRDTTPTQSRRSSRSPSVSIDIRRFAPSSSTNQRRATMTLNARTDLVPFEEKPALLRSVSTMEMFSEIDQELMESDELVVQRPAIQSLSFPQLQSQSSSHTRPVSSHVPLTEADKPLPLAVQQLSGRAFSRSSYNTPEPHSSRATSVSNSATEDDEPTKDDNQTSKQEWWDFVLMDSTLRAGLPHLSSTPCVTPTLSARRMEKYSEGKLRRLMAENLNKVRRIKEENARMLALDSCLVHAPMPMDSIPPEFLKPTAGSSRAKQIFSQLGKSHAATDLYATPKGALAAAKELKIVCGILAAGAGFDASNGTALEILTGIAREYIIKLGRAARNGLDMFNQRVSASTLLRGVLSQNGVEEPDILTQYAASLGDLNKKLDTAWEVTKSTRKQQLSKAHEVMASASASGDVSMSPANAGHSAQQDADENADSLSDAKLDPSHSPSVLDTMPSMERPEPFISLHASDDEERLAVIESQIGLLRPFLLSRMKTDMGLVDDARQKYKSKARAPVEASGRIPVKRKLGFVASSSKRARTDSAVVHLPTNGS